MDVQRVIRILALLVCGLSALSVQAAHTQIHLLLGATKARPGDTILAGIQLKMDEGWHTYWNNPGDSGMATRINWQLPAGLTAGEPQWPIPEKLFDTNLTTYIYTGQAVALVPIKISEQASPGTVSLKAKVSWLECAVLCVPGNTEVQDTIEIGNQAELSPHVAVLQRWQKRLPQPSTSLAPTLRWEGPATGDLRPVVLEWTSPTPAATNADFYPDANEQFEVQAATESVQTAQGKAALRKQVKKLAGDWPARIAGVLVLESTAGRFGYAIDLPTKASARKAEEPTAGPLEPRTSPGKQKPLWLILIYAFLGGLILNIMPCVLPVIALKILGFVNQAKEQPAEVRRLGLIYTSGVIVSFLILAGIVIAIKTAGHSVGWGFQFNSPYFLVAMTVLAALISLNLFGLFEVTLGGTAMTAASNLSSRHGASGAFFNGLLATVLATSCTAPVLGTAVGFAFAQPAGLILLILLTVGVGLAAPYIVLSWHPAWLCLLPKPGLWMERFKVAMGFPMLGAAVWLCSLLAIHYGERAWYMAVFLVFLAIAAWIYGEFVQRGQRHKMLAALAAIATLVMGYGYALEKELQWRKPIQETASEAPATHLDTQAAEWQPWSTQAVEQARAAHRPVVVDFTARWCLTCNTIVKPTLESEAVKKKLKEINAVTLLADYTRQPPAITAELQRFGRAGVPLVLVYSINADKPPAVFDLVTPSSLLAALDDAARQGS